MLKVIHDQECKSAALTKARDVTAVLQAMKLKEMAKKVADNVEEMLSYMAFPLSIDLYPR